MPAQKDKGYEDKQFTWEIKTYRVEMKCGKCKVGRMQGNGDTVNGKTPHACTNCQREAEYLGDPYPRTITQRYQITAIP